MYRQNATNILGKTLLQQVELDIRPRPIKKIIANKLITYLTLIKINY